MPEFPVLPVLERVKENWRTSDRRALSSAWLVCCQHLLESSGSLFEALIDLGAQPERVFILGKAYSTHLQTAATLSASGCHAIPGRWPVEIGGFERAIAKDANALWLTAINAGLREDGDKIIILDDGGHCARNAPDDIAKSGRCTVVEQTTSGLAGEAGIQRANYPIIAVAASAAKRILESPLIADAILDRLDRRCMRPIRVGVLGHGALGKALTQRLMDRGNNVSVHDRDSTVTRSYNGNIVCSSTEQLLSRSDLVIGCTGQSAVRFKALPRRAEPLALASGSSGDVEFRDLLVGCAAEGTRGGDCPDVVLPMTDEYTEVRILRSGFPINFDNTAESVPGDQIQLTRGLLLSGVLQAVRMKRPDVRVSGAIPLLARLQQQVVECWMVNCRHDRSLLTRFNSLRWIKENS